MNSKQTARKRSASERAPLKRRNEPAPLCSFAGTAVTPVPREVGMRTSVTTKLRRRLTCLGKLRNAVTAGANAAGHRHDEVGAMTEVEEVAA